MTAPRLSAILLAATLAIPASVMAAFRPIPPEQECLVYDNKNDGATAIGIYRDRIFSNVWHAMNPPHNGMSSADWMMREAHEWESPKCVLASGEPRMLALLEGFNRAFAEESDWSISAARVKAIKDQYPKAPATALLEASYWFSYAWNARGRGYANTVSPDAWKLFEERLTKAESVLIDSKDYASRYAGWYSLMIRTQSALGRPAADRDKTFFEGMSRFTPEQGATDIATNMLNFLLPKWGGDWDTVDAMINWTTEHTKEHLGVGMYAQLYRYAIANSEGPAKLMKDTKVAWPKMKKSYEDLVKRYPAGYSIQNRFASIACLAGDFKTYAQVMRGIPKDKVEAAIWFRDMPMAACDVKAGLVK